MSIPKKADEMYNSEKLYSTIQRADDKIYARKIRFAAFCSQKRKIQIGE